MQNGISRGAKSRVRRSFSITLAVLVKRLSAIPHAIFAKEFIEQGIIAIASALNEPEAVIAPMSEFSSSVEESDGYVDSEAW